MWKLSIAAALLAVFGLSEAVASPQGTVNLAVPTGTVGMGGDGTYLLNLGALCGATSATLYATCVNQAEVNASGQLLVIEPSVGVIPNAVPASATYMGMYVGGNLLGVTGSLWGSSPTGQSVLGVNANVLASALPTGAATSALQTTGNTALSTINTTLGSPMQNSGGSVSVSASALPTGAATAANQEVTTAGSSATSAQAVQGVTGGVALPVSVSSLPLPSGAATSANQTNANQKTQIVDGSGNVIASTSNALNVDCVSGCSGGGGGSGGATPQATASNAISISTATTTKIVTEASGDYTYIVQLNMNQISSGTTIQVEYGTSSSTACDTGATALTGAYAFAANGGLSLGTGFGSAFLPIPKGDDVCLVTTGSSPSVVGSVSYTQSSTLIGSFGGGGGGGGGGGLSVTDEAAFTAGTSQFTPGGGMYQSSITPLTSGQSGMFAMNANRNVLVDIMSGSNFATALASGSFSTASPSLPANAVLVGGTNANGVPAPINVDPCSGPKNQVNVATSTGTGVLLVTGTASKQTYICGGSSYVTSAAAQVGLIEGTTSNCSTGTHAVYGVDNTTVTAANAQSFAANSGMLFSGGVTVAQTAVAGDNVCIIFTTTNTPQVVSHILYVQQ